jgi:23S rRNA pseudouridine1911/1915/1917 synthase
MNYEPITIYATHLDQGQRLDLFLARKLCISRAQVTKLIKNQEITSGGLKLKPSYIILGHEVLNIKILKKSSVLTPENIPLDILYSDEHIAVINKPKGLIVHPGAGVKTGTLCQALLFHFPKISSLGSDRPGIVHRLDKDTSGVILVAKTSEALAKLSKDFKDRKVKKIYRALVWGKFDKTFFELKTGHVRHPYNRLKFFTGLPVPTPPSVHVRLAHTSFEVLKYSCGLSELKATLHTGRTHQIRAHLSDINHPIVGDALYGGQRELSNKNIIKEKLGLKSQALHAESLEFDHPITQEKLSFTAPMPKDIQAILDYL